MVPQAGGALIGGISGGISSFNVAFASGQRGWKLFRSTVFGAGIGAGVGALTLSPFASASASSSLIAGSLGSSALTASLAGATSITVAQLATIASDPCAQFSPLQVGLSAIPGPFSVMNPLAIASRYRTGGVFYSNAGSNIAAGIQLGVLGTFRGAVQMGIGIAVNPPPNNNPKKP